MDNFKIDAALPGAVTTVLEASAGTGKTYAVAGLAARYVAEGVVGLDRLLVITFSRAATRELRDRVRAQLVKAAEGLGRPASGTDSDVVAVLRLATDGSVLDDAEVAVRRERLLDAIASFDAATIATTHEFCNAVLRSLGVAGDSDAGESLREDISELTDEVIDDLWLSRYAHLTSDPPIGYRQAQRVARLAIANRHAGLRPSPPRDAVAEALVSFADDVRREVDRRKRNAGIFTFDDMLSRLADAVEEPGSPAVQRMRQRWGVVLVDEFQDTDPVQWDVLRRAFGEDTRLVLIGDPKQAVYAFRGGDTPTYLRAVASAPMQTLGVNWRSDACVVDALQVLTGGADLGKGRITVHPVTAHHTGETLSEGGGVRLRQVHRDGLALNRDGTMSIGGARSRIAADLAADVARQLESGVVLRGTETGDRPLDAGDIAILVRSVTYEGPRIQAELAKRGVHAVLNAAESVMLGEGAQHWLRLLEAMEKPQISGRVRAAGVTPFFGCTAEQLLTGGDDLTDDLAEQIRRWIELFRFRGVAAVQSAAWSHDLAARVLAREGGDRLLTDLAHVGQLLHRAAQEERLGMAGLVAWLRNAIAEGNRNDSRRRRLDVDAKAVQIVTIHSAKGLEYPVVYLPQLFDRYVGDKKREHAYHEGDDRCLDVADSPAAREAAKIEDAEEDLRIAYVALTRAKAQVTIWWAPTSNATKGALSRFLFGREPGDSEVRSSAPVPRTDEEIEAVLRGWETRGAFRWEPSVIGPEKVPAAAGESGLQHRPWSRELDTDWRRTSYSGLVRAQEEAGLVQLSEVESTGKDDEALGDEDAVATPPDPAVEPPAGLLSPMNGLSAGATFGSLVHAVLEHADPQAPDLRAELLRHVVEQRQWYAVKDPSEALADAMLPLQHTPLGPLANGLTLAEIPLVDRLRELDFEIPMAGGDLAAGDDAGLPLAAFADALDELLVPDDPMRAYAERLREEVLGAQVLRGYLSGSIDVVLRVAGEAGPRFVVVDYKTNTLGAPGAVLSALDYTPDKVRDAMLHSHYPLQALLYSVVLHRYLRWRLPGYDPATHLGGVLYLYLRGMVGPDSPTEDGVPSGVFQWTPPAALVLRLSAILDGQGER